MPALKTTLSATVRLVFLLTVPAAILLAVLAIPICRLLYQHGRFGPMDTVHTAGALLMYCIGLPAFAAVGVITRAFYALGDTRTPVQASVVSVTLNLALNLLFVGPLRRLGLEHTGLALATSVTSIASLLQLTWYMRRRVGPLEGRRMLNTAWRVAAAAAVAALPCAILVRVADARLGTGTMVAALEVGVGALVAGAVGYGAMRLLKVEELSTVNALVGAIRRRLIGR
jgi:putative peptidoglycan lipid II flippase